MRIRDLLLAAIGCVAMAGGAEAAPKLDLPPPVEVSPLPAGTHVEGAKFARGAFQINEGATWAYEGSILTCSLISSPLRWSAADWELDSARLGAVFREEAGRAGFSGGQNLNLFETGPSSERFQVAALITGMDARLCSNVEANPVIYSGRMKMSVEWQVFDSVRREIVARVPTTAGGEQKGYSSDGVERTFYDAFRQNVRALLASTQYRVLMTQPTQESSRPSLPPMTFAAPPPAVRTIASSAGAVVTIFAGDGMGSGFLIAGDGLLLTNHHVVGSARYVKVRWPDGAEDVGEVLRSDPGRDVALVRTSAPRSPPLVLRTLAPRLGEAVFVVGTPLDQRFQGSVTKGVVSATRIYEGRAYIQSDAVVNGGNSGGPLLDEEGSVVGITVSGMEIGGAPVGINLFIPIDDALRALSLRPGA